MIHSIQSLVRADLRATDGRIGRCEDFLFDDRHWVIRYMVAKTRKWLPGRKVLISPRAIGEWDWQADEIPVDLSRQAIKESPPLESDMPVSRQYEMELAQHHNWPPYWQGPYVWGAAMTPFPESAPLAKPMAPIEVPGEAHLRSVKEVSGYDIQALDDKVGHVEDFLLDRNNWAIRYLVVDTRNWLPGRKVLVSPDWAGSVDWKRSRVHLRMDRKAIETSPEYDRERPLRREDEAALFNHYDRKPHWHDFE
jgi:hypothetical protein